MPWIRQAGGRMNNLAKHVPMDEIDIACNRERDRQAGIHMRWNPDASAIDRYIDRLMKEESE